MVDSKKRAEDRLLAATDPAAAKLVALMQDEAVPHSTQLAAAKDILDRAGIGTKRELEVAVKPWLEHLEDLIVWDNDPPDVVDAEVVDEPRAIPPSDTDWNDADKTDRLVKTPRGPRHQGR